MEDKIILKSYKYVKLQKYHKFYKKTSKITFHFNIIPILYRIIPDTLTKYLPNY